MMTAFLPPWSIWDCPWLAPAALALDLLLGDPRLPWPHPVCAIGALLHKAEPLCRHFSALGAAPEAARMRLMASGFIVLALASGGVFAIVFALISIPWLGGALALYFAWAGLAMGCLLSIGKAVLSRLEKDDIAKARQGVSWLVSRDVSQLDRPMLRKTLADTLSENFTDAFVAPWFWLLMTGPAGLWAYKAVSTMDSQWGYLTPRWASLGFAGAKTDDILAWLPARIAPLCLACAHILRRIWPAPAPWQGHWPGYAFLAGEAKKMTSPNSGWSMAACAWLCAGRMAGPSVYFGEIVKKGYIGPHNAAPWTAASLTALMRLMLAGAICGGALIWLAALAIKIVLAA